MKTTIKHIAQISTGIYTKPVNEGEVYYLQARHFDQDRDFISTVKPDLLYDEKLEKHFLQVGDIIVAAKGSQNFAIVYKGNHKPAVASSMFITLRIQEQDKILPDFLAWFINHPETQKILAGCAKGSSLPAITKADLGNLEIRIPDVTQQESIMVLAGLRKKEKQLLQQIATLKETYIQTQLLKAITT